MFSNKIVNLNYEVSHKSLIRPQVLRTILTNGGIRENSKVLEIGCSGENYQNLLKASTGCSCWHVELTGKALQAQRIVGAIPAKTGLLSYPSDFFDMVYSFDLICYASNFREYLEKVYRVLRPGGKVYTIVDLDSVVYNRQPTKMELPENIEIDLIRYHRIVKFWETMEKTGFKNLGEKTIECFAGRSQANQKGALMPVQSILPNKYIKDEKKTTVDGLLTETKESPSRYLLLSGTK